MESKVCQNNEIALNGISKISKNIQLRINSDAWIAAEMNQVINLGNSSFYKQTLRSQIKC